MAAGCRSNEADNGFRSMKVLFLTQIVPFPPDAGPKVKTWNVLRFLAGQGHAITLATFVRPSELPYLDAISNLGIEVFSVPIRRSRLADVGYLLSSLLTRKSFLVERDNISAMRRLVSQLVAERHFDIIHADQFTMSQFIPTFGAKGKRPKRIFDAHNANWSVIERIRENAPFYQKPMLALEQQRLKAYEGQIVSTFEHTLAVTEIDRQLLIEAAASVNNTHDAAGRIITVPIAVDTQALKPVNRQPESMHILTLGSLHYQPNADGIRWFLQEILPRIRSELPQTAITIIGKHPPADFIQLAEQDDQVTVTGYVPDLTPYLEQSAVMVIPVRAGGGMRVRILEAFSHGMPVVTTTTGLEGIDAHPGQDVLVADEPVDFARQVIRLLKDPALQESLSTGGRRLVEEKYDWQAVLARLNQIYCQ